ncbi:MAG: nucleotidyltransferase domain-containing protein [Patescibacteria group bacterium]
MARKRLNSTILKLIQRYKNSLEKNFPVTEVIVFGSQAKGTAKEWSDIDVCVVSPILGKDRHDERLMLSRYVDDIDLRIEPHPYHPRDLLDKWDPLAYEIRKYGIKVV